MKVSTLVIAIVVGGSFLAAGCGLREMQKRQQLFDAIQANDLQRVRALLDQGLDPNTEGYKGGRGLSTAAAAGSKEAVELLLEAGAITDDNYAELALRDAINGGYSEIVRILLEYGVSPNANFYLGGTPLMEAIEQDNIDIVELLLDHGAHPNLLGHYSGQYPAERCEATALALAAHQGQSKTVALLLSHHADAGYVDSFGCTAAEAAEESGHLVIAADIRSVLE